MVNPSEFKVDLQEAEPKIAILASSDLLVLSCERDAVLVLDSYFAAARQRRSRLEIKITILDAISKGNQRLAHIMYFAKLPPRMCGSIVRTMEQQGLVIILPPEEGRKTKRYALTDRGKRALDSYIAIIKQLQLDETFNQEEGLQIVPEVVSAKA